MNVKGLVWVGVATEQYPAAVGNLDLARAELDRAGVEVIAEPRSDSAWRWIHLRSPDGNVYTLAERRSNPISPGGP